VLDETASTVDTGERGRILLAAEESLRENAAAGAFQRWFILRLAGIYGPGRHHLLEQIRAGEVAGRGEHRLNLAHRDDIVSAILACFAAPVAIRNEILNVADDGPAPKREVVTWLASALKVPEPKFTNEPGRGRGGVTPDRVIANGKVRATLGWRPRFPTFREGYENLLSR
jgi:nucleoside-diphosphate-sugar epimerase